MNERVEGVRLGGGLDGWGGKVVECMFGWTVRVRGNLIYGKDIMQHVNGSSAFLELPVIVSFPQMRWAFVRFLCLWRCALSFRTSRVLSFFGCMRRLSCWSTDEIHVPMLLSCYSIPFLIFLIFQNLQPSSCTMKRGIGGPQGQNGPSTKRPRIQNEDDFQHAFAQILDVPNFPAAPPTLAAGSEKSLARVPTRKADKEIERLLGLDAHAAPLFADAPDAQNRSGLPREFMAELRRKYQRGEFDGKVMDYYAETLPRGDSANVSGQGGRGLLLRNIMRPEDALPAALVAGPAWRPVRVLGKGGFGEGRWVGGDGVPGRYCHAVACCFSGDRMLPTLYRHFVFRDSAVMERIC